MSFAIILLDSLGMLLFSLIVFLTIRHKKLRCQTCHLLIGLYFTFCWLAKSVSLFLVLSTLPAFLPFSISAILYGLLVSSMDGIFPLMLSIGIDRMSSIFFPIWYIKRRKWPYLFLMLTVPFAYLFFVSSLILNEAFAQPHDPSSSILPELLVFSIQSSSIFFCELGFISLTFCFYTAMALKLAFCHKPEQGQQISSSIRQMVFKSMSMVLLIQIVGWLIALFGFQLILATDYFDDQQRDVFANLLLCLLSLLTSLEVPLLLLTSSTHRSAFKKDFNWLMRLVMPKPKPMTISTNNLINISVKQHRNVHIQHNLLRQNITY